MTSQGEKYCSLVELPGLSKGFLSRHSVISWQASFKGHQPCLVRQFRKIVDTQEHRQVFRASRRGPRTPSKTTDKL